MKYFFIFISLFFVISCEKQPQIVGSNENGRLPIQTQISQEKIIANLNNSTTTFEKDETTPKYPGISIDQEFPIIEEHSFAEEDFKGKEQSINVESFQINVKNFTLKTISKNGKTIFNIKTLYSDGYWSSLVGISHLLGKNSKEIYTVANGTGGVCCTNYWITDVSKETPRNIFRSEDFGSFRNPMESFDADSDGIYELVQFDSAFRYFLDDCGSCSPEPRSVFKYDKKSRTYIPAKNLQQDFVKEYFLKTGKWIPETYAKLQKNEEIELKLDYSRTFLAHIIDLFYLGDESKAGKTFDKYYIGYNNKEKVRAEIKKRLKQSKFFQTLRKTS